MTLASGSVLRRIVSTAAFAVLATGSFAGSAPEPPCGSSGTHVFPQYGALNGAPTVGVWRDTVLRFGAGCPDGLDGKARLVVALATRFTHNGTLEDLAARLGAVSMAEGIRYWSVSAQTWRVLIKSSFAVDGPATRKPRPDFSASEVMSGRALFLVQDDTRSTGLNLYRLSGRAVGPDGLAVTIVNLTDIRFLLAPLFRKNALISVHFVRRLHADVWGYYGLTIVRDGPVRGHERSLVNRAAAYQRLVTGQASDGAPPLAR